MSGTKDQKQDILTLWRSRMDEGDLSWLDEFYLSTRKSFFAWCEKNYSFQAEETADIYQNAMTLMYENIFYNRIQTLSSSPATYLFGIAKNLILRKFRDQSVESRHEARVQEHWSFLTADDEPPENRFGEVKRVLDKTRSPCREIIEYFYIDGLSLRAISAKLGYESPEVVKTQKSRCMKALRGKVFESK